MLGTNGFVRWFKRLAILGIALFPIMLLFSQSLNQLGKINDVFDRSAAQVSASAVIDPVNPLESPTGEVNMSDYVIQWRSEEITPPNENVQIGAGLAGYQVGFYSVDVTLLRDDQEWFSFEARKVGYRRIQGDTPFQIGSQ